MPDKIHRQTNPRVGNSCLVGDAGILQLRIFLAGNGEIAPRGSFHQHTWDPKKDINQGRQKSKITTVVAKASGQNIGRGATQLTQNEMRRAQLLLVRPLEA